MKKIILISFLFISSIFAFEVKELKNINEIEANKETILMFSTPYCPWCTRQISALEFIKTYRKDIDIFKVSNNSEVYKELIEKYPFTIKYYPTSFIVIFEDNELNIEYEFQGYQKEESIIKILDEMKNF